MVFHRSTSSMCNIIVIKLLILCIENCFYFPKIFIRKNVVHFHCTHICELHILSQRKWRIISKERAFLSVKMKRNQDSWKNVSVNWRLERYVYICSVSSGFLIATFFHMDHSIQRKSAGGARIKCSLIFNNINMTHLKIWICWIFVGHCDNGHRQVYS